MERQHSICRLVIAPRQVIQNFVALFPYNDNVRYVAEAMANLSRQKRFVGDALNQREKMPAKS